MLSKKMQTLWFSVGVKQKEQTLFSSGGVTQSIGIKQKEPVHSFSIGIKHFSSGVKQK